MADYAVNFLYFMGIIRSSSPETLRAYRADLRQAFEFESEQLPTIEQILQFRAPPIPATGSPGLEIPLLQICRAAQKRWSDLSHSSRNRKAATLKSFLGWMFSEKLIEQDLSTQIIGPKVPHRLPHYLSVEEITAVLQTQLERERNPVSALDAQAARRDLTLILLLYGGGLRVSEACRLEWPNVASDGRTVRIRGKGDKDRIVALPAHVAATLLTFRGPHAYVFGAEPLSTRTAYEIVRAAGARAALIKPLHPHALRHSFATHLLSSGANLRTLQELLGHQTLQATQRYTHLTLGQLAATLEEFHPLAARGKRKS